MDVAQTNKERQRAHIERDVAKQVAADPERSALRASALYTEARTEKRLADNHRHRARRAWMRFAAFKENLERLGIQVVIEDNPQATHPQRRTSDDENPNATQ